MHISQILFLAALLTPAMRSQTCIYSFVSDPLGATAQQPRLDPLGQSNTRPPLQSRRTQFIISRFRFQNAPIRITGLAFSITHNGFMTYSSLQVRMAHTVNDTIDGIFANNYSSPPQTVLDTHDYVWPHVHGQWTEIGLQTPFVYTPPAGNLLVEVLVSGASSSNSNGPAFPGARCYVDVATNYLLVEDEYSGTTPIGGSRRTTYPIVRVCTDLAHLGWTGSSCPGSGGTHPGLGFSGSAVLGSTTNVVLSNALPSQFALLAFGWDATAPFPQSLGSFGMPTCWQYFNATSTAGLVTDSFGVAMHSIAIPVDPSLSGLILFSQYYVTDPAANAAQIVSTNMGRIQPGL